MIYVKFLQSAKICSIFRMVSGLMHNWLWIHCSVLRDSAELAERHSIRKYERTKLLVMWDKLNALCWAESPLSRRHSIGHVDDAGSADFFEPMY